MKNKELFREGTSFIHQYILKYEYPFEILPHIKDIIVEIGSKLGKEYLLIKENVWIHETVKLSETATIEGPCIIDAYSEIRCNAYIRENVIMGKHCVIGNSSEIKNSLLCDNVQVPHFNYVGDSVLGNNVHLGAGSILSNLKSDKSLIIIQNGMEKIETKLKKAGAFLGDDVEVGCNSVLTPGTVVLPKTIIYPLVMVRGVIPASSIVKSMNEIVKKQ